MISTNQTFDRVIEEERINKDTPNASMIGRVVSSFFKEQADAQV